MGQVENDAIAAFMAKNLFTCQLLAARISADQCANNRRNKMYSCSKCTQDYPMPSTAKAKLAKAAKTESASPWRGQINDRSSLAKHEAAQAAEPAAALESLPSLESLSPQPKRRPAINADTRQILQLMANRYGNKQALSILRGELC